MKRASWLTILAISVFVALGVSGLHPHDRATWLMEVVPILIVAPLLVITYRRFPLSTLLYLLIAVHAVILMVGGAYTYAHVPFGFWLQDVLGTTRNPYDKIGHFAQGFVPALAVREILLRGKYLTSRAMAAFLAICVALAISAGYEMIEWWSALAMGQGADEFLGTQGDMWDTQSDMFFALIGAIVALFVMTRLQDRQIAVLAKNLPTCSG